MTGFDYLLIALIGISAAVGFWRGLVSEALALGGWLVAFLVARHFGPSAIPLVSAWFHEPSLQLVAAYVLVFIAVLLIMAAARWLLRELIHAAGLGFVDRFLGACFGLLRGLMIVVAVALLVGLTGMARTAWWRNASLSAPLELAATACRPWLPETLAKRLRYR
ncbi:MAG: CvpA family protein [Zoogloea sp.]|nr:CvpA family protein [Zoogloea sp.]